MRYKSEDLNIANMRRADLFRAGFGNSSVLTQHMGGVSRIFVFLTHYCMSEPHNETQLKLVKTAAVRMVMTNEHAHNDMFQPHDCVRN